MNVLPGQAKSDSMGQDQINSRGKGEGKKKSRLGRDAKIISFKKKKKRYIKYLSKKNLKIIPLQMIPNDQIDYGNNSPLLRDCKASATSF